MAKRKIVIVGFALVLDNFHVAVGLYTTTGFKMSGEKEHDHVHTGNATES